jgi:dipeptidyl aminopeptidase/acylaminoacyl peptidase
MVWRRPGTLPLVAIAAALVALPAAASSTNSTAPETALPYGWSWPTWSTTGTLAFQGTSASGRGRSPIGVFVASRSGKHLRRVAVVKLGGFPQPLEEISWAPRGTRIVWDHRFGEAANKVRIFVADARRGGMRSIARGREPAWAPAGKLLAYKGFPGIHVIRPDGRGDRQLTRGAFDGSPSWSPDGGYLVFTRRAGALTGAIYVVRADGTQLRQLTPRVGNHPVWSPDGRQIAFDAFDPQSEGDAIYVIDVDGTHEHRVASSSSAFSPEWSPSSAQLAFVRYLRGEQEETDVAVVARDGAGGEKLLAHTGWSSALAWSPNGKWIAYDAWPRGCRGGGIHVVSAGGGRSTQITPCRYGGQ